MITNIWIRIRAYLGTSANYSCYYLWVVIGFWSVILGSLAVIYAHIIIHYLLITRKIDKWYDNIMCSKNKCCRLSCIIKEFKQCIYDKYTYISICIKCAVFHFVSTVVFLFTFVRFHLIQHVQELGLYEKVGNQ